MSRLLLKTKNPAQIHRLWWFYYLFFIDMNSFKQNYLEAWDQQHKQSTRFSPTFGPHGPHVSLFIDDQILTVPIPPEASDEIVIRRLRMFYRMTQVGAGLPGLLLPKKLKRIDIVQVSDSSRTPSAAIISLSSSSYSDVYRQPSLGFSARNFTVRTP